MRTVPDRRDFAGKVGDSHQSGRRRKEYHRRHRCGSSGEDGGEETEPGRSGRDRDGSSLAGRSEWCGAGSGESSLGQKGSACRTGRTDRASGVAGNDANVAALGEMWKGGGAGTKNLILATLGTGVGGGIIVNGHIVTGSHGAGGEIGHCRVNRHEEEACNCGNKGCLEQYASATGIARLARRKLKSSGNASVLRDMDPEKITAKDVFDACKAGDSLAVQVIDQFAGYLGNALAVFATVVDPEVIVLGGGVSKAGDLLIEVVKKVFREDAFYVSKEIPIVLAKLGNDAGIYGAAKLAIDGNS